MKSIKSKVLMLVVSGMLLISLAVGTIGAVYVGKILDADSNVLTNQVAETESGRINDLMIQMEYTVKMMENIIVYSFEDSQQLSDARFREAYIQDMKAWIVNTIGRDTEGVASYFLRIAPELSDGTSGFFVAIREGGKHFEDIPLTDLTDMQNGQAVPWYSEPARAGNAVWIMPYNDGMNHDNVIAYVAPIYKDGLFLGVIGMEIDFAHITDIVDKISVYDNGFAYLTDHDNNLIYSNVSKHQLEQAGTDHGYAEEKRDLNNGMCLTLHVDYADIQSDAYSILSTVVLVALLIISVFIALSVILSRHIIRPLHELADSAESIVDGKYEMQLDETVDKEIFALGSAMQKTSDKIAAYMNYINALAYRDTLTGVKNVAAYNEMTIDIERRMRSGETFDFAILVADINMLKLTNDLFGHEAGNRLIVKAAEIISSVFKNSPAFRIGGDEFVVLLENEDLENVDRLVKMLDEQCSSEFVNIDDRSIPVSIARGVAAYNYDIHVSYADIFARADREMYVHKNASKQELEKQISNLKKDK